MSLAPRHSNRKSTPLWGDDVDDDDTTAAAPIVNADGTKTVVAFRVNDDGKKVKVTSRILTKAVISKVNAPIAQRRALKKFGDCTGLKAGPDTDSTSLGEQIALKLAASAKAVELEPATENSVEKMKLQLSGAKITCRICKGDHFTAKCPFKDTHQDSLAGDGFKEDAAAPVVGTSGKYVPPGMRGGTGREGIRMGRDGGDASGNRRDDYHTLRITNLSDETTESDVKDLVGRFGSTSRVFVARDRDTNMCKGFAFVSFYDREHAERCMRALHGYGYDNLILHVEFAKNKE